MNAVNEIKKITKENIIDRGWLDKQTFSCCLMMSDKLKELLSDIIDNNSVKFLIEYWADTKEFRYLILFEHDVILINNMVECDYVNNLVLEIISEYNN